MLERFSVKKPLTILVAVVLVILLGVVAFTRMTPDLLPDVNLPYVVVVTTYAGANPEQVETVVTKPVEQSMATLNSIKSISSQSSDNVSMVIMEFSDKVSMDAITVDIREKLNLISGYWDEYVGVPYILKLNPNMLPINISAVTKQGQDTMALTAFLNDKLMYRLEGVEGVASVSVSGGVEEEITVLLSQEKINALNARIQGEISDQFAKAKRQVKSGLRQAQEGKTQLALARTQLEDSLHQLKEQIDSLRGQIGDGDVPYLELKAEITERMLTLTGQKEVLVQQRDGLQTIATSLSGLLAQKEQMEQEGSTDTPAYAQVVGAIAAIDQQLQSMNMTREDLSTTIAQLNSGIAQIDQGLAELESTLDMLNSQGTTVEEARKALVEMDTSGSLAIYENLAKLEVNGQVLDETIKTLSNTLEEIEDSMTAALDKANLEGILTMDMVSAILQAQNFAMPAGYVTDNGQDVLVRIGDKFETVDQIENLMLMDMGLDDVGPIYLGDVADVVRINNSDSLFAHVNGSDSVVLSFSKQSNYATAEVSENIARCMADLGAEYPGLSFTTLMDQGDYIHIVVDSVLTNLLVGAVLSVLILLAFLRDIRPTLIIACSIPISVMFAVVLMYFSGVTLNIISLAGLAIGVGMLVDNSIVVIENIYRLRSLGVSPVRAAVSGAGQVAASLLASTLTTVCVFVPIVFVEGLTRQLFTDMALTITYSLMASLVVALTLVPAAATGMLRKTREQKKITLFDRMLSAYRRILGGALAHKAIVLIGAALLLVISFVWAFSNGFQFMPNMDSPQISLTVEPNEGTTWEELKVLGTEVEKRVMTVSDVETVGLMTSSGNMMGLTGGGQTEEEVTPLSGYIVLKANKSESSQATAERIEALCADLPCKVTVSGSSMNDAMAMLGGSGISINVYGEDADAMRTAATEIAKTLTTVPGTADVSDGLEESSSELRIHIDKNKAMAKGLTTAQVYAEIAALLTEEKSATTVTLSDKSLDVVIVSGKAQGLTPLDIRNHSFTVKNQDGEEETVYLGSIATFENTKAFSSIQRSEQRRYVTVTAAIAPDHNITFVTEDAKKALESYAPPAGITLEYQGENEAIMDAMKDLLLMMVLSIVIIYGIMVAQFQSLLSPAIVMFTIPLAFTGGLLAVAIFGMEMSIVAMLGMIMLVGIIVNNGIVLIDYVNQLRVAGRDRRAALLEAGVTRLRPVLMTTLTTILGLLPMALGIGTGAEMMQPMAIVCIGGLLYATLMTLVVVPVMYDLLHRRPVRVVKEEDLTPVEL
ncbi:MAG: efflux RND transporter permease subunit [Clostridia bacterium]|nr:efflux RND transporter permease subunit [Clostridia bacterium]